MGCFLSFRRLDADLTEAKLLHIFLDVKKRKKKIPGV